MKRIAVAIALVLAGFGAGSVEARAAGLGDQVVVVFNTRVPESRDVAEHYADRRQVPSDQVIGLDLPDDEVISRSDYRNLLEKPLLQILQAKKLLRYGSQLERTANGGMRRVHGVVLAAKIRYLVLCYGVPLKIDADPLLDDAGSEKLIPQLRRNEAAVDSELACLPLVEQGYTRAGPMMNPFFGCTNAAVMNPTNDARGILMVARLDGPTAGIARSLVDKAMEAEADGLWGRAYFDMRGLTNGPYKIGDDWLRRAAVASSLLGFETTIDTNEATFPAGFPMSQIALYAGWYDEHVSGPFAQPVVEFMPGAFAYHLHSFSALTLRSTTRQWVGPLLAKGVTATMGCVYEPYLRGTPDMGIFFPRFIYFGFTFGEAAYACQTSLSWQTTVVGDPLYRPFGKSIEQQRAELESRHSKSLEWLHLRVADLELANREPAEYVAASLEALPLTASSAVLTEKLASLYAVQGMPESSIHALQQVLKLDPTPQQRIRVMINLASQQMALGRQPEAYAVFQQFLKEFPDYPDQLPIYRQLLTLAQHLGKPEDVAAYEHEASRLASPPDVH
jgi:uncharacterized protein (TIGR03790 family)